MSASLVFLSLLAVPQGSKTIVGPGAQKVKIAVGADAAAIAKVRPGHYVANRDVRSLPTLADLSDDKKLLFTGNLYVLSADKNARPQIVPFVAGRKRVFDKGAVTYTDSLRDFLRSLDEKADVRLADATFAHFEVSLPKEAKKLDGFDGTITFFVANMKPEQALTITLKKGKVVRTMP